MFVIFVVFLLLFFLLLLLSQLGGRDTELPPFFKLSIYIFIFNKEFLIISSLFSLF